MATANGSPRRFDFIDFTRPRSISFECTIDPPDALMELFEMVFGRSLRILQERENEENGF